MKREDCEYVDLPAPVIDEPMEEGFHYIDLPLLLKQGDLDIRSAAQANPSLLVIEYCDMVSQFIELAPDVFAVLKKFARQDFNIVKKDYKLLENAVGLLETLNCGIFVVELYFLKNAYRKKSNWSLASHHAEQIIESFSGFYDRIRAVRKTGTQNDAPPEHTTLHTYIDYIDKDRKPAIVAVDDSPDILKAIYSVLKDEYKVIPLTDPTQLESTLQYVTPDLFLLDYRMPEITGFDLIPIIRSTEDHKDTPVIFLTSQGSIDHKSAAVMLGACDFLVKPLSADELRRTIAKHIVKMGKHG